LKGKRSGSDPPETSTWHMRPSETAAACNATTVSARSPPSTSTVPLASFVEPSCRISSAVGAGALSLVAPADGSADGPAEAEVATGDDGSSGGGDSGPRGEVLGGDSGGEGAKGAAGADGGPLAALPSIAMARFASAGVSPMSSSTCTKWMPLEGRSGSHDGGGDATVRRSRSSSAKQPPAHLSALRAAQPTISRARGASPTPAFPSATVRSMQLGMPCLLNSAST
jgi:hypothetical protein